jgi:hypothetical protein
MRSRQRPRRDWQSPLDQIGLYCSFHLSNGPAPSHVCAQCAVTVPYPSNATSSSAAHVITPPFHLRAYGVADTLSDSFLECLGHKRTWNE